VAAAVLGAFAFYPPSRVPRDAAFGQSYYRYGKFYFDEGDYEKAVENLRKATLRTPEITYAYIVLGVAYERLGQNDTALATFREGAMLAPDNPIMQHDYGAALVRAGRYRESVFYYTRAVELAPQLYEGWVDLGGVYEQLGDRGRAEEAYRRALALEGRDADVNLRLAWALYRNNKWSEAAIYAAEAAEIDPDLSRAHLLLGILSFQLQDYEAARGYFETEASIDAGDGGVYLLLGATYFYLGDSARARDYYQRYIELGGQPDAAMERDIGFVRP
jgi:Flp pilus assembly protein TadD